MIVIAIALNISGLSQKVEYIYTSPRDKAEFINPGQKIILKTGRAFSPESLDDAGVSIVGSAGNDIDHEIFLSQDGKTLFIKPGNDFRIGEKVTVIIPPSVSTVDGINIEPIRFSFNIRDNDKKPPLRKTDRVFHEKNEPVNTSSQGKLLFNHPNDYPEDFPVPLVEHYQETENSDYIFMSLNPRTTQYNHYLAIFDKYGIPIFYRRMERNYSHLHKLPDGNLAYARNTQNAPSLEKYFLMDSDYVVFDSITCGNGYDLDMHDILLLENGHYLVMSYDPQIVDMSQVVPGGQPDATVVGLVIQEVDNEQNVYFQWRSWDHFEITDATSDISLTANYIDYVHGNAFDFDLDGNLLVSSRHLDEITKINYTTGDVMWRFGLLAENNQFTILNDPLGFSHQHDVRVLPNGNITIFDNGNLRTPQYSQAIEYQIDEQDMTATRVWYYQHAPSVFGAHTGSHRRQSDNTSLIGWGTHYPLAITEVKMDGSKTFELILPDLVSSYRSIRSPWETTLFTTVDRLHFGNYSTTPDPKVLSVLVTNNAENQIKITSIHSHEENFFLTTDLPVPIPSGQSAEIFIGFLPPSQGDYSDILTLNYDQININNTERIARQIQLKGIWDDELPMVSFEPEFGTISVDPSTEVITDFNEPVQLTLGGPIEDEDIPNLFLFKENDINGENVEFTGTINDDATQITLYPSTILEETQPYYVRVKPNLLMDMDGNVIDYPELTRFSTGELVNTEDGPIQAGVKVFPVPFNDRLIVETNGRRIKSLRLLDVSGGGIMKRNYTTGRAVIETSNIAPGVYLVEIISGNGNTVIKKAIKTR